MGRVRASQDQTDTGPDKDRLCQPTRLGWRYGYTAHRVFLICSGPFSLSRPATFQSPATFWSRCINFEMSRILFTLIFVSQIKNKLEVYDIISGHKREEKQQRLTTQHENINSIASSFNFDISWLKIPQTITQNCTPKQPIWDDKDMSSSSHFLSKPGHLGDIILLPEWVWPQLVVRHLACVPLSYSTHIQRNLHLWPTQPGGPWVGAGDRGLKWGKAQNTESWYSLETPQEQQVVFTCQ